MGSLFNYKNEAVRFDRLKNSEKAQKSVIFGVETIVFSVIAFVVIVVMRIILDKFNGFIDGLGGGTSITQSLMQLFRVLILLIFGYVSVTQYASAGIKCYFQFKLNDNPIKWVALSFACVFFVAGVVLFILSAL